MTTKTQQFGFFGNNKQMQEMGLKAAMDGINTVVQTAQAVRELYLEEDETEETKQQEDRKVVQEILRMNHLAKPSMRGAVDALDKHTNAYSDEQDFVSKFSDNQKEGIDLLEKKMPEERARPSLVGPLAPIVLSSVLTFSGVLGGKRTTDLVLRGLENGV